MNKMIAGFNVLDIPKITLAPTNSWEKLIDLKEPFRIYDWVIRAYNNGALQFDGLTIIIRSDYTKQALTWDLTNDNEAINAEFFWKDTALDFPLGQNNFLQRPVYLKKGVYIRITNDDPANTYDIDFTIIGEYIQDEAEIAKIPTHEPTFFQLDLPTVANQTGKTILNVPGDCKWEILQILNNYLDGAINDIHYINIRDINDNKALFLYDQNIGNLGIWPAPVNDCTIFDSFEYEKLSQLQIEILKYTAISSGIQLYILGRYKYE